MPRPSKIGGCFIGEDPERDGRAGQPRWTSRSSVGLVPLPQTNGVSLKFSLWRIPGRKQLTHEGPDLQLWSRMSACVAQFRLDRGLTDSNPFGYVFQADELLGTRFSAVLETLANYQPGTRPPMPPSTGRPSRADSVHVRALQAFDATTAGASHRDIGEVLFGADAVANGWGSDSELRAQVRYLIRRAVRYVNGGYRALLGSDGGRERRPMK